MANAEWCYNFLLSRGYEFHMMPSGKIKPKIPEGERGKDEKDALAVVRENRALVEWKIRQKVGELTRLIRAGEDATEDECFDAEMLMKGLEPYEVDVALRGALT